MPEQLPSGTITIQRSDGSTERWRFQLSPDAPLYPEELKLAIINEFLDDAVDPTQFELSLGGTAASPTLTLFERRRYFTARERLA